MKLYLTLSLTAFAAFTANTALADDPQLRNRLNVQRHQSGEESPAGIGVYSRQQTIASVRHTKASRDEVRAEQRWNAQGQRIHVYVPVAQR